MIKTVEEFKRRYFPKSYEKEIEERMSPEEYGRKLGREAVQKVQRILEELE